MGSKKQMFSDLAGPVRLPVLLKSPIAKRALRPVLANDSLRLGFSGLVFFGAWAPGEATSPTRTIVIVMYSGPSGPPSC